MGAGAVYSVGLGLSPLFCGENPNLAGISIFDLQQDPGGGGASFEKFVTGKSRTAIWPAGHSNSNFPKWQILPGIISVRRQLPLP